MSQIEARLNELGITLPTVPVPVAAYVPAVQSGNLVFTSGQLPMVDGKLMATGVLGEAISVEEGYACARQCALNAIAAVKAIIGDLDRVVQVVKVNGFVASADSFTDQPKVINGASEIIGEIFGEAGKHARAAVGVNALPLGVPCEVEIVVQVKD